MNVQETRSSHLSKHHSETSHELVQSMNQLVVSFGHSDSVFIVYWLERQDFTCAHRYDNGVHHLVVVAAIQLIL